jgi:TatA/E family protein of Tat protein translocase
VSVSQAAGTIYCGNVSLRLSLRKSLTKRQNIACVRSSKHHLLDLEDRAMGEFSIWHWLIVLAVVLLLFGGGKVSGLMGDLAKGIKTFKQTMAEDKPAVPKQVEPPDRQLHQG